MKREYIVFHDAYQHRRERMLRGETDLRRTRDARVSEPDPDVLLAHPGPLLEEVMREFEQSIQASDDNRQFASGSTVNYTRPPVKKKQRKE